MKELVESLGRLRASEAELHRLPALEIAERLGAVGARFADPDDPLRQRALSRLPETSGLSREMSEHVLDGMARDWTAEVLRELLHREFGDPRVLDGPAGGAPGPWAHSAGITLHLGSGTVPGVTATSMIRSLLVKSPALVKPGSGDETLTELWAHGLAESDPELARAAAVHSWPGGSEAHEKVAFEGVDRIVIYGSDATVSEVCSRAGGVPVLAYGHRIGLGVVGPGAFEDEAELERLGRDIALAAATFDQRGCVSPQRIWVVGDVDRLAAAIAVGCAEVESRLPRGVRTTEEASAFQQALGTYELRAAADARVSVVTGAERSWAVAVDPDPGWAGSCLGRFITVSPLEDLGALPGLLQPYARYLQTVALEGLGDDHAGTVEALARLGASRFTTFEQMPWPRAWWRHDGQGPLRRLVDWYDAD